MFLRTGDGVTHTTNHWADRDQWAGGRRQLTLHLTFAGTGLADATAGLRAALEPLVDVVPPEWLHLTMTPLGFTDEVDRDVAGAVADDVFTAWADRRPAHPELALDTVLVGSEGVLLCGPVPAWLGDLVRLQRETVDRHLGAREWRDFWPHASLGYFNAAVPVEQVAAALADPAREASGVVVEPTLSLLELTCRDHLYAWTVLRDDS